MLLCSAASRRAQEHGPTGHGGRRRGSSQGTALQHADDKERRGKGTRAHGEVKGADGGAGDDPVGANRRRRSRWPEVEDDDVEGVAVLPSSRGSVELTGTAWRSSRARWMGEGGPVAVATASGGDGSARLRERERERRGRERRERSRGSRVLRGVVLGVEAAAGRRRWPKTHAHVPRFPSAYWQEEEDGSALWWAGPARWLHIGLPR